MDKYPVTHEMFAQVQLPDPSHWQDNPKKPVERVRWRDAKRYCNERSLLEGLKPCYDEKIARLALRLLGRRLSPAHRGRMGIRGPGGQPTGPTSSGPPRTSASTPGLRRTPSGRRIRSARRSRTAGDLHDMYGNVSQWCEDVYDPTYYKSSPAADPQGPAQPGPRREARAPRRQLEGQRRGLPRHLSPGRAHRRHRRLLQHRLLRVPLRAAGRWGEQKAIMRPFNLNGHSSLPGW